MQLSNSNNIMFCFIKLIVESFIFITNIHSNCCNGCCCSERRIEEKRKAKSKVILDKDCKILTMMKNEEIKKKTNIDRAKSLIDKLLLKSLENKNGSIHKIEYKNSSNNELLTDIEIKKYLNSSIIKFLSELYMENCSYNQTKSVVELASNGFDLINVFHSKTMAFHIERTCDLIFQMILEAKFSGNSVNKEIKKKIYKKKR